MSGQGNTIVMVEETDTYDGKGGGTEWDVLPRISGSAAAQELTPRCIQAAGDEAKRASMWKGLDQRRRRPDLMRIGHVRLRAARLPCKA